MSTKKQRTEAIKKAQQAKGAPLTLLERNAAIASVNKPATN